MNNAITQGRGAGREKRNIRREDAEKRNRTWQSLTPQQQLDELDKRFGKGLGASKQRAQLAKVLQALERERAIQSAVETNENKKKARSTNKKA